MSDLNSVSTNSIVFQGWEIEEILEESNTRLAPNQREFTVDEIRQLVLEHGRYINHKQTSLDDFTKKKSSNTSISFLIRKFSKTPHLLTTTPSSGGDLKR